MMGPPVNKTGTTNKKPRYIPWFFCFSSHITSLAGGRDTVMLTGGPIIYGMDDIVTPSPANQENQTAAEVAQPAGSEHERSYNSRVQPAGRASLRSAIDDKCRDCIFDPRAPGRWREQVAACEIDGCPLWTVRPRSRGQGGDE